MHRDYHDIQSKIPEPPTWWDEHAVPRYCAFHPGEAGIYHAEAALVKIRCQGCGTPFQVAFTAQKYRLSGEPAINDVAVGGWLAQRIREKSLHYGDPPNAGCCNAGPTMNSEPDRVLEYWYRPDWEWVRVPALEISLED